MKILLLESDAVDAERIKMALLRAGHDVHSVGSGRLVIRHLETARVDLLVLDWTAPDLSGAEILGWARAHVDEHVPVLCLIGRYREDELAAVYDAGADTYLVKPASGLELVARVNALLRRAYPDMAAHASCLELGPYRLDTRQRTIAINGRTLPLTPREFDLASLLFRNAGRVVPRAHLCKLIWGRDLEYQSRTLDTHVYRLRQKLELSAQHGAKLRALYQLGYCFEVS
jgi:two-component system phosphate regulon response regulator PhoB